MFSEGALSHSSQSGATHGSTCLSVNQAVGVSAAWPHWSFERKTGHPLTSETDIRILVQTTLLFLYAEKHCSNLPGVPAEPL